MCPILMPPLLLFALGTGVGGMDTISMGVAVPGRIKDGECLRQRVVTRYEWNSTCGVVGGPVVDDGRRLACLEFECLDPRHECGDEAGIVGGGIGNVIKCQCDCSTVNTNVGDLIRCTEREWVRFEDAIPFDVCQAVVGLPCYPRFGCWCHSLPLAPSFRIVLGGHDLRVCCSE